MGKEKITKLVSHRRTRLRRLFMSATLTWLWEGDGGWMGRRVKESLFSCPIKSSGSLAMSRRRFSGEAEGGEWWPLAVTCGALWVISRLSPLWGTSSLLPAIWAGSGVFWMARRSEDGILGDGTRPNTSSSSRIWPSASESCRWVGRGFGRGRGWGGDWTSSPSVPLPSMIASTSASSSSELTMSIDFTPFLNRFLPLLEWPIVPT